MVHVDKRITLAAFKQNLEPYVGVGSTQFKVFRVYGNNQEFESVRLTETFSSFSDDNKVSSHLIPPTSVLGFFSVYCTVLQVPLLPIGNYSTRKSTEKG